MYMRCSLDVDPCTKNFVGVLFFKMHLADHIEIDAEFIIAI